MQPEDWRRIAEPDQAVLEDPTVDAALIDESRIVALTRSLGGDESAALRFVADFVGSWPGRWGRLEAAWQRADDDELRAVLLSIQSSGAMVGAVVLAGSASDLLDELARFGTLHPATVARLYETGRATCEALIARLRESGVPPPPAAM